MKKKDNNTKSKKEFTFEEIRVIINEEFGCKHKSAAAIQQIYKKLISKIAYDILEYKFQTKNISNKQISEYIKTNEFLQLLKETFYLIDNERIKNETK